MFEYIGTLAILAVVAFIQNMAFTAVSRSRNAGDPAYHRHCAWLSNGVWLICYLLVWKQIWPVFENGEWWRLVPLFIVYVASTTEGSVFMMKRLLKSEEGKRQVGAR